MMGIQSLNLFGMDIKQETVSIEIDFDTVSFYFNYYRQDLFFLCCFFLFDENYRDSTEEE